MLETPQLTVNVAQRTALICVPILRRGSDEPEV